VKRVFRHYARRFLGSLSRRPPTAADEAWARARMGPELWALVAPLSNQDRRHLIANARAVAAATGPDPNPTWVQAALLHDVGKRAAGLGTVGRSVATVTAVLLGRTRVGGWADRPGWPGRFGRYERHGEIGADLIRAAGGSETAAWWSEVHHHRDRYEPAPVPPVVLAALEAADWD
jgi:hypothetical protein